MRAARCGGGKGGVGVSVEEGFGRCVCEARMEGFWQMKALRVRGRWDDIKL